MKSGSIIKKIPSLNSKDETMNILNLYDDWFYSFNFSNGAATAVTDNQVEKIHSDRAEIIFSFLDEAYEGKWQNIDCLDVACHQGWFSSQLAVRGARKVTGIDIRERHIEMAKTWLGLTSLSNLHFQVQDFLEIDPDSGKADLVLFLGILYHLDNPLQALRKIRSLTKNFCIIETQVAKGDPVLECCWGADPRNRKGPALALIESDYMHAVPDKPLVLVPTLSALYKMLYASGFDLLFLGIPTGSMEEQFQNFDRVIIFAHVTD